MFRHNEKVPRKGACPLFHSFSELSDNGEKRGQTPFLKCLSPFFTNYFLKKSGILIDCSFTLPDGVLGC